MQLAAFHRRLHAWYSQHGRKELPWRNTRDAYSIYVSEVMLQQTQVKTVLERYYHPFLQAFPTISTLAAAPQEQVLQAWQGLGYYSRALNLHKAAKQAGKSLPKTAETLMELPGVGRNTAHAVAAFAYREPVPVMEANVKRVLCRIFALQQPQDAELWNKAQALLDREEPFDYNQAMMDIGAMVCTKRAPKCSMCSANSICKGKENPESYPARKVKKKVDVRPKRIAVLRHSGEYFATPRTTRFLGGLYHFIECPVDATAFEHEGREYAFADGDHIGDIRQQYSHFTLEAEVFLFDLPKRAFTGGYKADALARLPMSMAEHKILELLEIKPISPRQGTSAAVQ